MSHFQIHTLYLPKSLNESPIDVLSNDPTSSTKGDTDKYIYIYNSTCVDNIKSHPTLNNLN